MSDFRSLLASFQAATGTENVTSSTSRNNDRILPLKECISNLWRKTQIKQSFNVSKKPTTNKDAPIHVAICAVIVSTLPHEDIWKSYLDQQNEEKSLDRQYSASMYVHAKTPSAIPNNSWLKSKLISISHNPSWNDIKVVQAMLSLIEYALKDKRTTHVMFVTESCIPITSLRELCNYLEHEKSYVNAYNRDSNRCTRFDEHACFQIEDIPNDAIYKNIPGWCMLSTIHAKEVLDIPQQLQNRDLFPLFKNVWAPEEVYFPTALALVGALQSNDVVKCNLMWAKWDERSRGSQRAHPILYDGHFSQRLVEDAKQEGCFFMRKFKQSIRVDIWNQITCADIQRKDNEVSKKEQENETSHDANRKRSRDEEHGEIGNIGEKVFKVK